MGAIPHGSRGAPPIRGAARLPRLAVMASHETAHGALRGGPVVLIVEDNADMRALIKQLVQGVASAVYECGDGEHVRATYAEVHPDWVLMDIDLGEGVDGLAVTRALRAADPAARIMIVTEHGDEWYRREAAAAGAAGFLLKENLLDLPALLTLHATTETEL